MWSFFLANLFFFFLIVDKALSASLTNLENIYSYNLEWQNEEKEAFNLLQKFDYTFIVGFKGTGKSHFAHHFALKNHERYPIIWYINTKNDPVEQLSLLSKELRDHSQEENFLEKNISSLMKDLQRKLEKKNKKILLILDNFSSSSLVQEFLPFRQKNIHLLFISSEDVNYESKINLGTFKRSQSIHYLKKMLPSLSEIKANRLAEIVKDYPPALTQAALFLHHNKAISLEEYALLFKENLISLWEREERILNKEHQSFSPVHKNLQEVLNQHTSPLFHKTLILFSLLSEREIPFPFIMTVMADLGFKKEDTEETLSKMVNHFYVQILDTQGSQSFFCLSPFLSPLLLAYFHQEHPSLVKEVARALASSFYRLLSSHKDQMIQFFKDQPFLDAHISVFLENLKKKNILPLSEALPLNILFLDNLLYIKRQHQEALDHIDALEPYIELLKDKNLKARFYSSAGDTVSLHRLKTEQEQRIVQKMQETLGKPSGVDSYEIVRLQNSLGQNYLLKAEFKEAQEIISRSLSLVHQFPEPLAQIPTYYFAAWASLELKEYCQALNFADQAIALFSKVPDTAIKFYVYNIKAFTLISLERFQDASQICDLAIKKCEEFFGEYQSDTLAEALTYRAQARLHCRQFEESLQDANKAIKIYNSFYKGQDKVLDQAQAWNVKGDNHLLKHEFSEAHLSYVNALTIFKNLGKSFNSYKVKKIYEKLLYIASILNKKQLFDTYKAFYQKTFHEQFNSQVSCYYQTISVDQLVFSP